MSYAIVKSFPWDLDSKPRPSANRSLISVALMFEPTDFFVVIPLLDFKLFYEELIKQNYFKELIVHDSETFVIRCIKECKKDIAGCSVRRLVASATRDKVSDA